MQFQRHFRTAVFLFIIATLPAIRITPAEAQQTGYRRIAVTALVDGELMERDGAGAEREIKDILLFVTNVFREEFGPIAFDLLAVTPWKFPYGKTELQAADALSDANLQARNNADSDFTLGFTRKKLLGPNGDEITGYGFVFGTTAIMRFNDFTALHEIGHLLGARHSQDPSSIMYTWSNLNKHFDDANQAIIKKTLEKFSIQDTP